MAKTVINAQDKAILLIGLYQQVYVEAVKLGGDLQDTPDGVARQAAEDLQRFVDGYIEDFASKDLVVDKDESDIPFSEQQQA